MRFSEGDRAERLARRLQGVGPATHDSKIVAMLAVARGLAPSETLSEGKRSHTLAMALRELQRPAPSVETRPADQHGTRDGDSSSAPHTARLTTSDGLTIVMADLEKIDEARAQEMARHAAELLNRVMGARELR